ncbi:hypothetical protein SCG7086_AL_00230 [Chlamydiales bacterium SCGC AG-110-P3]|nr:hypothetical protein SCG7086_AL_00230 [Chlamydiales bacterium SCGC AG-110-P3]
MLISEVELLEISNAETEPTAETTVEMFLDRLQETARLPLRVKINDNRSTMLSVRWANDHTRVSVHRMFVTAPGNVMEALACYIRGDDKQLAPSIRAFIEEGIQGLDYSHTLDKARLRSTGVVYDVKAIYDRLNAEYFAGELNLSITWFGAQRQSSRRRLTFGLYDEPLKLIKIHRILDHEDIPPYVLEFVIYHEITHHVCPPYVDEEGVNRIHHSAFKARERNYRQYYEAQDWIKKHREDLFRGAFY